MPEEKKPGYVYILTNPSFREDWVKIGKSSRPVDVRSKELDNTAVPLPFEIYATLKTAKYDLVEKKIHKQIDRLTDLRIRKGREFFNVRPEVAYDILKDEAELLDDAELWVCEQPEPAEPDVEKPAKKGVEDNEWYQLWVDFINYNKPNGPYANSKPNTDNWHGKGLKGIPGSTVNVVATKENCRVEVFINNGDKDKNKEVFDTLLAHRAEIEQELGVTLEWQRNDAKVTSRIYIVKPISFCKKEQREEVYRFFCEYTDKFRYTFSKYASKF